MEELARLKMVADVLMRALALIVLVLPLTLADPVDLKDRSLFGARGEKVARQGGQVPTTTFGFPPNTLPLPTKTGGTSTPTPFVAFNSISRELTTCQSSNMGWIHGGPNVRMNLGITNIGVPQDNPSADSNTGRTNSNTQTDGLISTSVTPTPIAFFLANNIDATLEGFTWDKVNVTQGSYVLIAQQSDTGEVLARSSISFFVRNGTDVSCLQNTPSSTSQPPPTAPQTSAPPSTDTGTPSGAAQSNRVNIGGIVGGVVGGVALLGLIILAYACCRRRGKRRAQAPGGEDKSGADNETTRPGLLPFGRWGKLGSGSFNDKDRSPVATEVGNGVGASAVTTSATRSIGRPRSRSGAGGGFFATVLKPSSSTSQSKKSPAKKVKKPYNATRHNSHSDSIGGMLSSSATTTMTGSSAFHGTEDEFHPYSYERPVAMSPISAGGSSAASSFRVSGAAADTRSPFSDPSDRDSDNVVYGLYGTVDGSNTGMIPIGYDGPPISGAPTPSPVPSHSQYGSSTGAVAGHSSDSDPTESRRTSRGHHDRSHSYSAFREGSRDHQQHDRVRAQTLLGGMYTLPNSQQQTLPETPRNDSMLTFTTTSSAGPSRRGSRSHTSPSPSIPMQAAPSSQSSTTMGSSTNQAGGTFGGNATRRAARKPVPSYSPDELATTTNAFGSSSVSSSPGSSPTFTSPLTHVEGTVSDGQREVYRQHELLHKDSAGSMKGMAKMHLLIPDMPPPQRG